MKKKILASILSILTLGSVFSGATYALFQRETNNYIDVKAGLVKVNSTLKNFKAYSRDVEQSSNVFENGGEFVVHNDNTNLTNQYFSWR